jgi:Holliday junction resolvasome RuvABC DNA-binding subunit
MVLELRDKLPVQGAEDMKVPPAMGEVEEDVLSALMNLGYQRATAERALMAVTKNGKEAAFETTFREALGVLSK